MGIDTDYCEACWTKVWVKVCIDQMSEELSNRSNIKVLYRQLRVS
jgi:hypothetical protein